MTKKLIKTCGFISILKSNFYWLKDVTGNLKGWLFCDFSSFNTCGMAWRLGERLIGSILKFKITALQKSASKV